MTVKGPEYRLRYSLRLALSGQEQTYLVPGENIRVCRNAE